MSISRTAMAAIKKPPATDGKTPITARIRTSTANLKLGTAVRAAAAETVALAGVEVAAQAVVATGGAAGVEVVAVDSAAVVEAVAVVVALGDNARLSKRGHRPWAVAKRKSSALA